MIHFLFNLASEFVKVLRTSHAMDTFGGEGDDDDDYENRVNLHHDRR